jgi:hypothetical protein
MSGIPLNNAPYFWKTIAMLASQTQSIASNRRIPYRVVSFGGLHCELY